MLVVTQLEKWRWVIESLVESMGEFRHLYITVGYCNLSVSRQIYIVRVKYMLLRLWSVYHSQRAVFS